MGRLSDARTWVLVASGYGLAVSVWVVCTALTLDKGLIAGWGVVTGLFYMTMIMLARTISAARGRRWWLAFAALANVALCAFGLTTGIILFGPPAAAYVALFVGQYAARATGSRSTAPSGAASSHAGQPRTSAP
jgi:hypothetical protein